MSLSRTLRTAQRILTQIRSDKRTIVLLLVVPILLEGLLAWVYLDTPVFDQIGAMLIGIFPLMVMFVVTSVATLRERSSGTLERLMTTPIGKTDFMLGYAVAFSMIALAQGVILTTVSTWVYDLTIAGPTWMLILTVVLSGVLGSSLGLLASAFAQTEFQAVQFLPAFIMPQLLLCGLFVPRDQLPTTLSLISDVLPLSYAVDAVKEVATDPDPGPAFLRPVLITVAWIVGSLFLGSLTLRRRTE